MPFKKIGLAITFSPTGRALLIEAKRLKQLFNSKLHLIHVGEKIKTKEEELNKLIDETCSFDVQTTLSWQKGDPAKVILSEAENNDVDLLIAGALEKEKALKYYLGSVARRIMRQSHCSCLILPNPKVSPGQFKKIVASTDFSYQSEKLIKKAYEFAKLEDAEQFEIVREFQIPGIATSVYDFGSTEEIEERKTGWQKDEEAKLKFFVRELNLNGIQVNYKCVFGKEGWAASQYARKSDADLLVVPAPKRSSGLLDRIFTHDFEFSIREIYNPLLIMKD